jgi:hypothetical protein
MSAAPTSQVTRGVALMILAIFFTAMDATAKGVIARYPAPHVIWVRFARQLVLVLLILGPRLRPARQAPASLPQGDNSARTQRGPCPGPAS